MSLSSRDVLLMIRARDYASREVRNVGGAFGALGKAIRAVDNQLTGKLNESMARQNRMVDQSRIAAQNYARVIDSKVVASQKKQTDALYQSRHATERDIQGHKDASTALGNRNRQINAQNAAIRASLGPQRAATELAHKEYLAARRVSENVRTATEFNKAHTNALRRQHDQLQSGTLTWQKYIQQRQAETAANREQQGLIRNQIADRQRLGRAQIEQINTTAKREQDMLQESAHRYGEQSRTHQAHLKRVGAAERAAYEEQAQRAHEQLRQQQRLTAALMGVGIAATIVGAALLSFGAKGVSALRSMADEAMEFQFGMARAMTQILDDVPATTEGLVKIGRVVGTEIPAAMDTMGETMFFIFSSLRADVPAAENLLRGFAKEAVAGTSNIEAAAKSTIAILNGMNLEFKDLTRVQDFQFQTVRRGVITYEQLAANIGKLIPSLARAGQEIETGGAMLAFLTRQGLSAEMATTAAARSLEILAHPRVIRRMEDMGLAIRDQRGEFLPLIDILSGMNDEIGHLTAPGRAAAMWEIFGGAGYRIQARRFFDTVFTSFDKFTWHVGEQQKNAGAMQRAYDIMFAEPVNQIQLFQNQLQVLRQEIGDRLIPIVMQITEVGKSLIAWFRDLDEDTKDAVVRFMAISTAAMLVTGAVLALAGMFTVLLGILGQVLPSLKLAAIALVGTPLVIMAVVTALFYLVLHWDKVSEATRKAIDWLKTAEGTAFAMIAIISTLAYTIGMLGGIGTVVTGLGVAFLTARDRVLKFAAAIQGLFAKSGPIGWAILLIGGLVGAFVALRGEARRTAAIVKEYADAQYEVGIAIDESVENFDNYQKNMGEARREIARTRIANEELTESIHAAGLSERDFVGIIGGSVREQLNLRAELDRKLNASAHLRTQAAADEREALQAVSRELNYSIAASKLVEEQIKKELRARGGISEVIADYMEIQNFSNDTYRVQEHRMREVIRAALILQAEMGNVDDETLELAMSLGILDEETGEALSSVQDLSQAAEEFGKVAGDLTSITDAWSNALSKANEGLEEPKESLLDFDDGLQRWIASMNEGRDTTRNMFTDMTSIISNNSDLMNEDINTVIGSVLAMGEAGPDAMALLAEADPEEFLEVLRIIRLNAALTSEEVRNHIDEMLSGTQNLIDDYSEGTQSRWNDILEALVLTTATYGDLVEGNVEGMMQAIAGYIEAEGDLSVAEMEAIMGAFVTTAQENGPLTSAQIATMMDLMTGYVESGGDILEEDFSNAMHAMWVIAQSGGELTVSELAEALGVGIEQAREIGEDIGIEFTEAARTNFNAASVVAFWRTEFGNEIPSLETRAYNGGVDIARQLGFGLQAVTLRMPNIQMPSNTAAVRNALRAVGKNKGGYIPGSGPDRDSVLVHGTPREFVIRRKAADTLSPAFLHALNTHGADVFKGKGLGVPPVSSASSTGSQSSGGDRIYNYMPGAQVVVKEPEDIEIELAKFESWLRSEQP